MTFSNLKSSTDSYVNSFTFLKGRTHAERALPCLQRVASLVKPIMRKHSWTLPVLSEFFPKDDNLIGLNVNHGQKIMLRLRPYNAPDSFYDEEQVVLVMLHELTHNVYDPHDDKFYKFLAELEEEYYQLKRTGYAGEGFHSTGNQLGGSRLPQHIAKEQALRAAERRKALGSVSGGPSKLGPRPLATTKSTKMRRQLAAEAAERRMRDQKSCATTKVDAEEEANKALEESVVIDLTGDSSFSMDDFDFTNGDDDDDVIIVDDSTHAKSSNTKGKQVSRRTKPAVPNNASSSKRTSARPPPPKDWACHMCTLLNHQMTATCGACTTARPKSTYTAGWGCLQCGETGINHDFWSCTRCGSIKTGS